MGSAPDINNMSEEELREFVKENYFKIRDCHLYYLEYSECSSFRGRFQQYFVHGNMEETSDCKKWKEDYKNCLQYFDKPDENLRDTSSIIIHEDERLRKRLHAHFSNNLWNKRKEPPSNWNAELPDWITERQKNAFPDADNVNEAASDSTCTIS